MNQRLLVAAVTGLVGVWLVNNPPVANTLDIAAEAACADLADNLPMTLTGEGQRDLAIRVAAKAAFSSNARVSAAASGLTHFDQPWSERSDLFVWACLDGGWVAP